MVGSSRTSTWSPAASEVTVSGTMISALALASEASWCEAWPETGVTWPVWRSRMPRRNDLLSSGERAAAVRTAVPVRHLFRMKVLKCGNGRIHEQPKET